jgi:hypothetical protein
MRTFVAVMGLSLQVMAGAAEADPASMVLRDGFDGTDFAPEGGLYYRENFEQSAGRVEFQSEVTRDGTGGALRLSVRPLTPEDEGRWSERAEIWERTELRVPYDRGVWYGFSVKFGEPVPLHDHRYLIAQWKREIGPEAVGDFSPFLALRMTNGHLFATVETNYHDHSDQGLAASDEACAGSGAPAWLRPDTNQTRVLVASDRNFTAADDARFTICTPRTVATPRGAPLPSPHDGWIDFAIYVRPGPQGDGRIEIFANGGWVVSVTGHIGHGDHGLGAHQYFKFGPYREGAEGEWVMYYDNFIRTPECRDLLDEATCAMLGL